MAFSFRPVVVNEFVLAFRDRQKVVISETCEKVTLCAGFWRHFQELIEQPQFPQ
jgi:hypothetical protein